MSGFRSRDRQRASRTPTRVPSTWSRRRVLQAFGTGALGLGAAVLVGCSGGEDEPSASTPSSGSATTVPSAGTPSGEAKAGGRYRWHLSGDPPGLDPFTNGAFESRHFAAHVYSRLFKIDAQPDTNPFDASVVGDVAESAETEDGLVWVVKLKPGVKMHNIPPVNGRELTAEDVKYSLDRAKAPTSLFAVSLANITNVEVVDSHTLRFTHSKPNADFYEQLADNYLYSIMPVESDGQFDPSTTVIGSGPWIMKDYQVGSQFRFDKHPEWYASDQVYLDGVDWFIIPEYVNAYAQFQSGQLHQFGVRADDVLTLRGEQPDVQWEVGRSATTWTMSFSPEEFEPDAPWRDERFRRACSMAINRDELYEFANNASALEAAGILPGKPYPWNNLVSGGMGRWWLDPQSDAQGESAAFFQYNPEEARKLLDAMGAAGSAFPLPTTNRYGDKWVQAVDVIHGYLSEIGLAPQIEMQDYTASYMENTWQKGDFRGVSLGITGGFSSISGYLGENVGASDNLRLLHTPDILELLDRQSQELDLEARTELVYDLQRVNAEHMYMVPLSGGGGPSFVAYRPEVKGGLRRSRGYAPAAEVIPNYWLDV